MKQTLPSKMLSLVRHSLFVCSSSSTMANSGSTAHFTVLHVHIDPNSRNIAYIRYVLTYTVQSNLLGTLKGTPNLYFLSELLAISPSLHSVHKLGTE